MDPPERWQSIAPATDEPGQQRPTSDSRRRRQAIPVACVQCRSGKAKCDGTRPRCTRCHTNDLPCQYDVAEGVSRAERMKLLKKDTLARKVEGLERIIDFLRSRSDNEATTVLARLRLGDRVEDVAASLPPISSAAASFKPPNLYSQDSAESSRSGGTSHMSSGAFIEGEAFPSFGRSSTASPIVFPDRRPSIPSTTSSKGKHPVLVDGAEDSSFLTPLFDRQDFLLPGYGNDIDDEPDVEDDGMIDPRLLGRVPSIDFAASPASSIGTSKSATPSPQKEDLLISAYATQLRQRQQIVDTIRLHPNLNLRNLFGNLPFSSSIRANNHPTIVQDSQITNLSLPTWSMMTINTRLDPGSLGQAFSPILQEAAGLIQAGTPIELVIETHPNIAALFDPPEYERSGILSRWAAGMVHGVQRRGNTFTCFGSMYIFWWLMRWMIYPSPKTYAALPEWLRPTPNQLFMPHINILDFIAWPAFRELAVQIPSMQQRMQWLMEMCITVRCDWRSTGEEAVARHPETGLWDLCPSAQQAVRDLSNWSVGPSFRGYVSNADSYVNVRTEYNE
ncbi:hypothetical protein ACN47E_009936 [Coniothyrium glycines]